jgi:hypothetical protein
MTQSEPPITREVTIPAQVFLHLRRALKDRTDPMSVTHALHAVGFATGDLLFEEFSEASSGNPSTWDEARFWSELRDFLARKGWGRLQHERVHPAFGALHADGWGESSPEPGEVQAGCAFTTGLLAQMLGRTAGGPIAVLEVACESRGDAECRFLFGSEGAIESLYRILLEGTELTAALEAL